MNGWLEMTETDELLRNRFLKPDTPGYQARVPEFDYLPENLVQWKSKEFRVGEGTLEFVRSISLHEMSPDVEVDVTTRKLEAPGDDYYQGASPGNASEDESCPGPPPSDLDEVESEAAFLKQYKSSRKRVGKSEPKSPGPAEGILAVWCGIIY